MTRDAAQDAVRTALDAVPHGARVVLAVSGGPDSVGMARLVVAARPDVSATAVHIRHGLRDDSRDAAIAVAHARALGLPHEVVSVEVAALGTGPEDAARRARWEALRNAATAVGAAFVATGHTADDQAETVLLNLARGTGLPGAGGMPPLRPLGRGVQVIRPVLGLRRATVRTVAAGAGLPLAHDPTNTDPEQRRSRARHDVLPRLRGLTGGGSDPVEMLARFARHARRDNDALELLAARELAAAVRRWGPIWTLPFHAVDGLHEAVATRVVRLLLQRAAPSAAVSERVVAAVLALRDGRMVEAAGGVVASRGGGLLAVTAGSPRTPLRRLHGDAVDVPELGIAVRRTPGGSPALPPWAPPNAAPTAPVGDAALVVRCRRPGDRIATTTGERSVARAMAAAGVPRVARDAVPVVEDERGIVWVPGVAIRPDLAGPARLRLELLGGE